MAKNNATSYRYKRLVRIMKHIKNEMVEDKKTDGNKITSFLVECLVYHVPNNVITGYRTWTETVKRVIIYLYDEIKDGHHTKWCEVSDMVYLSKIENGPMKMQNNGWLPLGIILDMGNRA